LANILIMEKYIFNTYEEAQIALNTVNAYFGLPCGETLNWTDIQEGDGFWFLESDRLGEVLG
jgi:hypothetical protein